MPHYHFNLHNSLGLILDEEGRELPDLEAARDEAIKGVRSILAGEVLEGQVDLRGRLEITDEGRKTVLVLAFAEAVEVSL